MALRTWDPFRELDTLRRQVEQVFEEYNNGDKPFSRASFLPGMSARTYPLLNLGEDKDSLYVDALAPGLNPDSLDITVVRDTLRIAGEKAALNENIKPEAFHRRERAAGKFIRTLRLPVEVNLDKVEAKYEDGLLHLRLPKAEAAKPRQIEVKVN
jgi:HSP20 family protein